MAKTRIALTLDTSPQAVADHRSTADQDPSKNITPLAPIPSPNYGETAAQKLLRIKNTEQNEETGEEMRRVRAFSPPSSLRKRSLTPTGKSTPRESRFKHTISADQETEEQVSTWTRAIGFLVNTAIALTSGLLLSYNKNKEENSYPFTLALMTPMALSIYNICSFALRRYLHQDYNVKEVNDEKIIGRYSNFSLMTLTDFTHQAAKFNDRKWQKSLDEQRTQLRQAELG